uniref:Uncharacterized protein n=1 Tax=Arundo donax TaxID=35708 RepID=A0A0A9FG10_ARUDO
MQGSSKIHASFIDAGAGFEFFFKNFNPLQYLFHVYNSNCNSLLILLNATHRVRFIPCCVVLSTLFYKVLRKQIHANIIFGQCPPLRSITCSSIYQPILQCNVH